MSPLDRLGSILGSIAPKMQLKTVVQPDYISRDPEVNAVYVSLAPHSLELRNPESDQSRRRFAGRRSSLHPRGIIQGCIEYVARRTSIAGERLQTLPRRSARSRHARRRRSSESRMSVILSNHALTVGVLTHRSLITTPREISSPS